MRHELKFINGIFAFTPVLSNYKNKEHNKMAIISGCDKNTFCCSKQHFVVQTMFCAVSYWNVKRSQQKCKVSF